MKKRVLFIINGLGLGNSTRCSAIIHELFALEYQIDVITSSNGLSYFSESNEVANLFSFHPLLYGKANGKLSILKTILMLPGIFILFIKNCLFLKSLLRKNNYRAIIFDSDYTALSILGLRQRPLLIAINNAAVIVEECKKNSNLPRNIHMQYRIEKMDYWFHNIVPDLVICPTFNNPKQIKNPKIKCTLSIIRSGLISKPKAPVVKNILVMLSGSQFGSDTNFLSKLPILNNVKISVIGKSGISSEQISFYGKIFNNLELMNAADILVINAGFSAVSEAIILKTPAVVIPIENHAEQYINSLLFEKHGLGLIATQENAHEKILELLTNFQTFSAAHKNFHTSANGAKETLRIIDQCITSSGAYT